MLRIAILTSHPIQYQAPLFRELARRPDVALKVFFCWDFGIRMTYDPDFGRAIQWDVSLLDGYDHELVPNIARFPGTHHFFGLVNPAAPKRILAWRPDVVIVHGYAHATVHLVIRAMRRRGVPCLLRGESNLLRPRPFWVRAAKRYGLAPLLRALDGALSIGTRNTQFYRYYGVAEERVFLAPYTVDNAFFRDRAGVAGKAGALLRAELGVPRDDVVVLFAAKLIPIKRCADLIRAFGARECRGATLVVAGDGRLRRELEALAAGFPSASIRFVGFVNQSRMPAFYAMSDLFVLPSSVEPWGLVVNEAMNLGCAVVVSDMVGSAADLVSSDNGWVFPTGDVGRLETILRTALADRDGMRAKGAASLARIADWDIRHTADGFLLGTRSVLEGRRTDCVMHIPTPVHE